ncbi:inactive beta-amylase 9-like [Salvia hispanica]|uniref:inactive beta-amylase 9-like n=1 Tax=Salvia hispanica TaxID=49212 RepID=UPI002008F89E|nr:inactive beta-amylase 9-like [Salvia hispanica]
MEISVIRSSQVNSGRSCDAGLFSFSKNLGAEICNLKNNKSKACCFVQNQSLKLQWKSAAGFTLRASAAAQTADAVNSERTPIISRTKLVDGIKLFVGLPLDTVSKSNKISRARAIAAGLKALKVLGVKGVELPVWWGVAEKEAMGKYEWTSYLAVVEMVQKLGLELHVSLCFHASEECKIRLPEWVSRIGESDPDIYFADRSGQQCRDCLSFAVDEVPVLDGKTPVQVYRDFCDNFKATFSPLLGSTITRVSIGLGPDGELRYPSHHPLDKSNRGAGEFQCYDRYMLKNLKQHAETNGSPLWGLGGPHDTPSNDQSPLSDGFFAENGGSWETPYGDFFLSWYSSQLLSHGDRILSLAASTFKDAGIAVSGKVPLIHSWHRTRSRPAELTAGFYSAANRDGYDGVARIFSRNACSMILPGMDLTDENQPAEILSSPQSLLKEITASCREHGVTVSGQNSLPSGLSGGFDQIKKTVLDANALVDTFTYQRMGASFFSPEHFSPFAQFVRLTSRSEVQTT